MPALQHYALRSDSTAILRDLLAQGYVVVPEEPVLETPTLASFATFSPEIETKLDKFPCLLLEGPFTKHPIHFDRREWGTAAGTYSASESVGPRMRWCISQRQVDERTLTPGSVGHLSSYRDPTTNTYEPASEELKKAFKDVLETFKRHMVRVPIGKERIWVGKDAAKARDEGKVAIER